jgi:hypothetical protein
MLRVKNNEIYLTRGDTASFTLDIVDDTGAKYEITDDDQVLFTVKRSTSDTAVILQKAVVDKTITIKPAETAGLPYGTYYYDVQLSRPDGFVATVITPTPFIICEEVTF